MWLYHGHPCLLAATVVCTGGAGETAGGGSWSCQGAVLPDEEMSRKSVLVQVSSSPIT